MGLSAYPAQAALTLSSDASADLEVKVLANGLSQPTDMAELPDGRVVITQRLGDVVVVDKNGDQTESGTIMVYPEFGEQGLLGVVADPDFATNHYLYFYASAGTNSDDPKNKHKVFRIVLGDDGMLGERTTIIDKGLRASRSSVDGGASNHNGGGLQIYKGKLYLSVGDTGHNKTPPTNELGTCLNATNGKILRVNLDGSTPDDNPLSGETMVTGCDDWNTALKDVAPEKKIFSWGYRNPYRFWIDPMTSRMWIGDVGETTREEISVGSPIDDAGPGSKGEHFGWPFAEGTTKYTTSQQSFQPANSCMGIKPARDCIPPVYDYGHSMNNNCVIGGLIPDGCGWKAPWTARYLFGDNGSGRIWYLDVNADRSGVMSTTTKDFASSQGVGSFRMGANGVLYIAEVSGGVVDKVTPKGLDPAMCGGSTGGTGGMGAGGAAAGSTSTGGVSGSAPQGGNTNGGSSGTGPSGGRMGNAGSGATTSNGGSGTGGATSGGTSSTMGGSSTTMGGTSTTAGTNSSGGSTSTAGSGATSAAGTGGSGGDDKGGCGCRVGGDAPSSTSLMALSGLLGLMVFGRRRSRRAR
ncbi:MAG TPA: PQQ-dependent sugar dehydrogenase [Polyangiaceae bacterium]|nr:PQQ-dependent sugar dehydrogenase [Polyangiaceae bacterium]